MVIQKHAPNTKKKAKLVSEERCSKERKCCSDLVFGFIFIFILCKLYLSNHNGSTFFFILNFVFFSYLNTCLMTWLVAHCIIFVVVVIFTHFPFFLLFLLVDYLICTHRFHLNRQLAFFSFRMMMMMFYFTVNSYILKADFSKKNECLIICSIQNMEIYLGSLSFTNAKKIVMKWKSIGLSD